MDNKKLSLLCKWGTAISALVFVLSIPLAVYFTDKDKPKEPDIVEEVEDEVEEIDEEEVEPKDDLQYFVEEPTEEETVGGEIVEEPTSEEPVVTEEPVTDATE